MKCQLIANLINSGIPLEDFLSNLEKTREHIRHCKDCQEDKEVEEFLKKKIGISTGPLSDTLRNNI